MNHWLDNTWRQLQLGKTVSASGLEALVRGWQQTSTMVVGTLSTGAERWQAAMRQIHPPANVADALRERTIP